MKPHNKNILKVGITGGIGSGKSALCSALVKLGVPALYADEISKEICVSNQIVKRKLIKIFGENFYNEDGSLNKPFIANSIFRDASLRKKMERIVHPQVEKEIDRQINEYIKQGRRIVIIEAALIYEAGLNKKLDAVIVVDADETERINRIRKRDVVSEEAVRMRMQAQMDSHTKVEKADFLILNNGTIEELVSKAEFLYTLFNKIIYEDRIV